MDLVSVGEHRLYPVGRLDRNTTGLLLLTNDGDVAYRLSHPCYEVCKTYLVTLNLVFRRCDFVRIKKGLLLSDGYIKVDTIVRLPRTASRHKVMITLHSGRYRIVRRLFEKLGYAVIKLDRVMYAELRKEGLLVGNWRMLAKKELHKLNVYQNQ